MSAPAPTPRPALDRVGLAASSLCMIHCVATASLAVAVPALAGLGDPRIEWALVAVSIAIGATSLLPAYRRHGNARPLGLLAVGVVVLLLSRLSVVFEGTPPAVEVAPSVGGAAIVALAHLANLRASRRSCAHPPAAAC